MKVIKKPALPLEFPPIPGPITLTSASVPISLAAALVAGVYYLPNKTRISCGKISETFRENVEAYSKTANDKSVYFEIVEA